MYYYNYRKKRKKKKKKAMLILDTMQQTSRGGCTCGPDIDLRNRYRIKPCEAYIKGNKFV